MKLVQYKSDAMLFLVALIWGSGFIATEYALVSHMSLMSIMALRFSIAAVTISLFNWQTFRNISKHEWFTGSIAGCILFLAFYFQTLGQSQSSVSNSAFITATNVVMIPFFAWLLTGVKPTTKTISLACLTFIGVVILTVSFSAGISVNKGDLFVALCAILFALHISYLGKVVHNQNTLHIAIIQLIIAALLSLVGGLLFSQKSPESVNYALGIPAVIYLGLFSTCLCFFLQTTAQKRVNPSKVGIILSLESLFGTLFSLLLGLEPVTVKIFIGGGIILTAVMLTEIKIPKRKTEEELGSGELS